MLNIYALGILFIATILVLLCIALKLLNGVWQAILIGYLVYSIFNPLVRYIKYRLNIPIVFTASLCLITCYSSILLLLIYIIPIAQYIIEQVIVIIPKLIEDIPKIESNQYIEHVIHDCTEYLQGLLKSFLHEGGITLYSGLSYCVISPLIGFYMILKRNDIKNSLSYISTVRDILFCINHYWKQYITYQIYICLILIVYYSIALLMLNIDYAIQIGTIVGIISFIPYIGFIAGFIISLITLFIYKKLFLIYGLCLVFVIGQIIENIILVPILMGNAVSSNPLSIIITILFTNHILGFAGAVLALPIICCIQGLWKWWSITYIKYDD